MEKTLAKTFSYLFHPLIMTSLGMLIILNSNSSLSVLQPEVKRISFIATMLFTAVFPASMIIILYIIKMIDSAELQERKERNLPIALTMLLHLFTFFVMRSIPQLSAGHLVFLLCPTASLLVAWLVNRFMKLSIHMVGIGMLLGIILVLIIIYGASILGFFIIAVITAGILGTSRLILGLHTSGEVLTGFITGFLPTLLILSYHVFTVMRGY